MIAIKMDVLYKSGATKIFTMEAEPGVTNADMEAGAQELRDGIARCYKEAASGYLTAETAVIDIAATATIDVTVIFEA